MWSSLKRNWRIYAIEAWALGMFMTSAASVVILTGHPDLPLRDWIGPPLLRRAVVAAAMGITAVLLIYSPWGRRSGAHMNPAVTLAHLQLDRIRPADAAWYILAQFAGGTLAVLLFKWLLYPYISHAEIRYVATLPGPAGPGVALAFEFLLAFSLFLTILWANNQPRIAPYTGYLAGVLVALFILAEAPYSGMSINPARSFASAFPAQLWEGWWIYWIGPVAGMQAAAFGYRRLYRRMHGECLSMNCHQSGGQHDNPVYEVLGPQDQLLAQKMS
jgi:aquaporin Z